MRKLIFTALATFCIVCTAFAQQKAEWAFNHCNDDKFVSIQTNKATGFVTIKVKAMNPPSTEIVNCKKLNWMGWWFYTKSTWLLEHNIVDTAGITLNNDGWVTKDSLMSAHANISSLPVTIKVEGNIVTIFVKLEKKQLALLTKMEGLPDKKATGFEMGNICFKMN